MGFNCDEAVTGYEAYSILETLRDRYGEFLPLFARVMGDYRPSLYIFLTVPFIKLFGLNEFSTRLTASVSGILTILIVFLLAKRIFNKKVALVAALLLSVSPWYIHYTRIAYEVNLLPLLFSLGLWLFLESFSKPNYLILSAIAFGFSLNTYQSARVFIPLFLLSIIFTFRQHFLNNKKQTFLAALAFSIIFVRLFVFWISPAGMARATQVGVKLDVIQIIQNYLSFFNPIYLFFKGSQDMPLNPTGLGLLYGFELITVLAGLAYLVLRGNKEQKSLLFWLILYPIPAALVDTASPTRSLVGAPLFAILSSCGYIQLEQFFQSRFRAKHFFQVAAISLLVLSLASFSHSYFFNYPSKAAAAWSFGTREAIHYAETNGYDCIIMSSDRNSGCFALHDFIAHVPFYTQYPPQAYQSSPIPPWLRNFRSKVYSLGNYKLMSIVRQPNLESGCLYVVRPDEIQEIAKKAYSWQEVSTIKDSRGVEYFKLIQVVRAS